MNIDETLLEKSPFLRILPPDAVQELTLRMTEVHFEFGEIIVAEGEAADAFYLLTDGRARVLKSIESGGEAPLQRLRRGDSFGEIGLLSGGPRTASIRASEPTTVLQLARDDFDDCMSKFPQMREFVELQLQNRMLQGFLQQYTRFARTPLPVLQRILQFLKPVSFKKGEYIIKENDPGGSVYIVEKGRLTVSRSTEGERNTLAYLRPGDYFGELSLLEGMKRSASVVAATDCKLHMLAPEDWEAVLDEYTELKDMVRERINAYKNAPTTARMPLDFAQTPENAILKDEEFDDDEDDAAANTTHDVGGTTKFRFIRQIDETDCGVAALAMACRLYGRDISSSWIRKQIGTDRDGSNAKDICNVANELGLISHLLKIDPDSGLSISTPSLLHTLPDHWVLCLEIRNNKLHIADPAEGVTWLSAEELSKNWSGHYIELEYSPSFQKNKSKGSTNWNWLKRAVNESRGKLLLVVALMLLIALGESMLPVFAWQTIDDLIKINTDLTLESTANIPFDFRFIANSFQSMMQWRLFAMGGILIATLGLILLQRSIMSKTTLSFDRLINEHLFRKILKLPLLYFLQRSPADLHRRLSGIREIRNLLAIRGINALNATCQLVIFSLIMIICSWQISLAFLAIMLPVYCCLLYFSGRVLRPAYETLHDMEISFSTLQDEVLQGISSVKSSGREKDFKDSIVKNLMHLDREQVQSFFNISVFDGTVQAVWLASSLIFLWVGARLMLLGSTVLSVGGFIALLLFVGLMFSPVQTLLRFWADWQSASLLMQRINEVIEWPPEQLDNDTSLTAAPSLQGRVEFRDATIRFGGPNSHPALSNVSFTALPGQLVAIVGRSGSGKTVLCQTIASLLHPASGGVFYDGVSSEDIRLQELRKQIGLVLKDNRVFTGSVKSNIAFGIPEVNDSRLKEVCRMVGIIGLIETLPQGFDTIINEFSHQLSGNLRQGIALARALYNDPSILVMDQMSSTLDVETESTFFENLDEAFKGRSVFIATKRISIAKNADVILVMDKGKLVEFGKHSELMARRGLYYHLASRRDR